MRYYWRGVILMVITAIGFAVMDTFVRLAGDLPSIQKVFFRNLISLFVSLFVILRKKTPLRVEKPARLHLLSRCFFGTISVTCNFYAVDHMILSDASMLSNMCPFFAILFSRFLLRERINLPQGLLAVVAFGGCLLVMKPTAAGISSPAALIALSGGICAGLAYTEVRVLGTHGVPKELIIVCFSVFSCMLTLPNLIFNYHPMTIQQLLYLLGAGIAATCGQFCVTAAYTYVPAAQIAAYDYLRIPASALLGYAVFQQLADSTSYIGYVVICAAGVAMTIYNSRKNADKSKPGTIK